MKRVCGLGFFFFSLGMFAGMFVERDFTKVMITIVCLVMAYVLFFCK